MAKKQVHEFAPTPFLKNNATILEPDASEPPILVQSVRQAVFQWMTELNAAEQLEAVKLKPRRKLIFYGPPGCGKTTLAHHLSARLGLPLVVVNMQTIVNAYLGGTGNNLNAMFRDCEAQAEDCILFLDEFDSLAVKRKATDQSAGQEQNNIVVAILQRMDEFSGTLIAATNRNDEIDPAVWRRFDMHVEIAEPDEECRFAILKRYLEPFQFAEEGLEILSGATRGASPAMLRKLAESVKRDLVLAPRLKIPTDPASMFDRAVMQSPPHADAQTPPLWENPAKAAAKIAEFWPPKL